MSKAVETALAKERARLIAIDDPTRRVRAVNDFFAALDVHGSAFAAIREAAIVEMHQSMGYDVLARETGLSKSRVQQIINSAKRGV